MAIVAVTLCAMPFVVPPIVERAFAEEFMNFGLPANVKMDFNYGWDSGPCIQGKIFANIRGTPWRARGEFGAHFGEWHATLRLPETKFDDKETLIAKLMGENYPEVVSNLTFSGSVAMSASIDKEFGESEAKWTVGIPLKLDTCTYEAEKQKITVSGMHMTVEANGIDYHADIKPTYVEAESVIIDDFVFTNFYAFVLSLRPIQVNEEFDGSLLVSVASASIFGGKASLYSVYLDTRTLDSALTMFLEGVDAGEVLQHVSGFHGTASGRLLGKVELTLRGGERVHLHDAFLYSIPGEIGNIRIDNPAEVSEELALSGLDDATRDNVANALTDMNYSTLRFNLCKDEGGEDHVLKIKLNGGATREGTTVPVDINLNIHGKLNQLISSGIKITNQYKGK